MWTRCRNLRRVFKLSEMMKAQAPKDLPFKPLRVHVIGAGVMGADIAGWCVASGMEVSLQDLNEEQIKKGREAQAKLFRRKFKSKPQREAAMFELKRRFVTYLPYKVHGHRYVNDVMHPWLVGYRRHPFSRDFFKYIDVDPAGAHGA